MLIDTHCHINICVKERFDTPLSPPDYQQAQIIIDQALQDNVLIMLNIGTSLLESQNSIKLAQAFKPVYAAIGIHPNDLTHDWQQDIQQLTQYLLNKEKNKIVAIGECGIDMHYPDYNLTRQQDAFKTQIELALEHNLPVVVHTRDAGQETLQCIEQFKDTNLRGVIHCFSEDLSFAHDAIKMGFVLGIGGTITYPKNTNLRDVVRTVGLGHIILETDAPYLPPQAIRGKKNTPAQIKAIAYYLAELLQQPFETIAVKTTSNAETIFRFSKSC